MLQLHDFLVLAPDPFRALLVGLAELQHLVFQGVHPAVLQGLLLLNVVIVVIVRYLLLQLLYLRHLSGYLLLQQLLTLGRVVRRFLLRLQQELIRKKFVLI